MKTKLQPRIRGIRLTIEDQKFLEALLDKYPEQNPSLLIRRAIRELAQKEQVA